MRYPLSLIPHPFLYSMHPSAFRRLRLVASGQPIRILSRAVPFHFELCPAHILKLDLDGVAGIHGTQPLVIGAGGDDVSGVEPKKFC